METLLVGVDVGTGSARAGVLTTSGEEVTQFQTDEQGRFRVDLAPGDYVLHPESPNGLPFAADTQFTVDEHKFTQLKISYDSGIR